MNYWYVARPNELFLDIDNVSRSIKHARSRLQGAIECKTLAVEYVMVRTSKSTNHIHAIITLSEPMPGIQRAIWAIILHSDIYRGCVTVMRNCSRISSPDILISPHPFFRIGFDASKNHRYCDDHCECVGKHSATTMRDCPAAKRLRGEFRNVGFFGKPSKNECKIWPNL
jgi:hypothetical protein